MTVPTQPATSLAHKYREIRNKTELTDLLFVPYALVFARQYFWIIQNNSIAWAFSVAVTLVIGYFYITNKQFQTVRFGWSFWLVVALPLLTAYLLRAAFPDRSFDVLNYHLLHSDRSLTGPLLGAGDYFPTAVPFNPVGDTVAGLSRYALGFRLGTAINLLVLISAGQITDKLLRPLIDRTLLRSLCVLLILLSENLLFEISTYLVDLLALPLMLEATFLTLRAPEAENRRVNYIQIALLLGAGAAFKLTNLAVALPLLIICSYQLLSSSTSFASSLKQFLTTVALMFLSFIVPLLPFTIYIYRITGNPVFPLANGLFMSPFWPTTGGWDNRFGPHTPIESLLWPVLIWFSPDRQSELAIYSGRLSLGFIVAAIGLFLTWRNQWSRYLCEISITSSLLWGIVATGNGRYGLCQEVLAGVAIVTVAASLLTLKGSLKYSWRTATAAAMFLALVLQCYFAVIYFGRTEWGGRTSVIGAPNDYAQEAKLMFRDRSLLSFQTDEDRNRFNNVRVWFETSAKSTGFEVLLNHRAPIIAARQQEFFTTRDAWRQFISRVESTGGNDMYSLCLSSELQRAKEAIALRGLEIGDIIPLDLPFFSARNRISMMLIKVRIPSQPEAKERFETAWMNAAFASKDYNEEIVALEPPATMHPGEKVDIRFKVKNLGSAVWPSVGTKDFKYQINMGNHWIMDGVSNEDNRAAMSGDLPPGSQTDMKMTVKAPQAPGDYILEIDMVHEGVTWFKERGAHPLSLRIRVQP